MSSYLLFLLVLACPVVMWFMMRTGHGHAGPAHTNNDSHGPASIDDLHRRRDALDQEIAARERR